MADNTVTQTLYNNEWTAAYEQKKSWLRGIVTTQGDIRGDQFIFVIEGIADEATERGANGLIPYAADDQGSETCVLKEYHHLVRKRKFKVVSSSVPQRMSMQNRGVVSMNKKTDNLILTELSTTTNQTNSGTGAAATLALMLQAITILNVNHVPDDGERYGLLTPYAWAQMMRVQQFTSSDYVPDRPFMRQVQWRSWMGVKWAMHSNLIGKDTDSAECPVFHRAAIGHGLNQGEMMTEIGENREQDYFWARSSSYQGAKALQLEGIVTMVHDDTAAFS
ncbi:MAG: hypothetical protein KDI55_00370 [Anaerolineae bacterium]|nr:hypothetical protein [Anaerolineae bacterium]